MSISKAQWIRIAKMEMVDGYDLPEQFAPELMDRGYVEFKRWTEPVPHGYASCSGYFVTDKGREEFFKWLREQGKLYEDK
jgi:hypothetical protein